MASGSELEGERLKGEGLEGEGLEGGGLEFLEGGAAEKKKRKRKVTIQIVNQTFGTG